MAKVTRVKYSSKKFEQVFGERPIMEAPEVKHSFSKKLKFNAWERQFCTPGLKYSFNYQLSEDFPVCSCQSTGNA